MVSQAKVKRVHSVRRKNDNGDLSQTLQGFISERMISTEKKYTEEVKATAESGSDRALLTPGKIRVSQRNSVIFADSEKNGGNDAQSYITEQNEEIESQEE